MATKRALDLAGVPDYSEVVSSSMSEDHPVGSAPAAKESRPACEFCGATTAALQQCKECRKGIYCSALCFAEHHLGFCTRR
jgi:hypothetical protein